MNRLLLQNQIIFASQTIYDWYTAGGTGGHEAPSHRTHIGYAVVPREPGYVLNRYIDMIMSKYNDTVAIITNAGYLYNARI